MKDSICAIINIKKEKSARIESGCPGKMDRTPPALWQHELRYFIVEKIFSIGICGIYFNRFMTVVLHATITGPGVYWFVLYIIVRYVYALNY